MHAILCYIFFFFFQILSSQDNNKTSSQKRGNSLHHVGPMSHQQCGIGRRTFRSEQRSKIMPINGGLVGMDLVLSGFCDTWHMHFRLCGLGGFVEIALLSDLLVWQINTSKLFMCLAMAHTELMWSLVLYCDIHTMPETLKIHPQITMLSVCRLLFVRRLPSHHN